MTLGFKREFGLPVWEGSKTHTIRDEGGRAWRAGMTCHCFIDSRQKGMARLGNWTCTRVEPIEIRLNYRVVDRVPVLSHLDITINGVQLTAGETVDFAWRDGFRPEMRSFAPMAMAQFWRKEHKLKMQGRRKFRTWRGVVIHWKWTEAGRAPLPAKLAVAA